jgi:hypothetical protein
MNPLIEDVDWNDWRGWRSGIIPPACGEATGEMNFAVRLKQKAPARVGAPGLGLIG